MPRDTVAVPQQMQRLVGGADRQSLQAIVAHALLTTRATTVCQFHPQVIIRVGDDAAETHAFYRAKNAAKATKWSHGSLEKEIARQLAAAADRVCPHCSTK
jgi:hypothetical protein